ncbi:MAG: diguanylate cyclase [Candidatus Methylomirabilales bacterium]
MPRILIAEDDLLARAFLRDILGQEEGWEVIEAQDGPEAIEIAQKAHPDLILLDLVLPSLDGRVVCKTLKADDELSAIPIIVTTSRSERDELRQCFEAGADDYLLKPVDAVELRTRVEAHLRAKEAVETLERERRDLASVLEIARAVSSTLCANEIFQIIVTQTAKIVGAVRCSLVLIDENGQTAYVLASHDDPTVTSLEIQLAKYPEICEAIARCQPVVINDVCQDPLVREMRDQLLPLGFESILVIPIIIRDSVVGTIILRSTRRGKAFGDHELRLCEIIAEIAANALRNAHLFENMHLNALSLERLTLVDDLTQCYNRRFLTARLEEEFQRAARYRSQLSLIMMDIDGFKKVNDVCGHRVGDALLRALANMTRQAVRKSDLICRYGGEEFTLLLPLTPADGAHAEAERLWETIRSHRFPLPEELLPVTISLGVASFPQEEVSEGLALLERADRALYRAKQQGKDRVACSWTE